jgi:hypothetical protein
LVGVRGVLSDDRYWLWPDVSGDRQLAQGLGLTQSYGTCVLACAETSWIGADKISEGGAAGWDDKAFFVTTAAD